MQLTHDERAANGAAIFNKEWGDAWWRDYPLDNLASVNGCGCAADWAGFSATGSVYHSDRTTWYQWLRASGKLDKAFSCGCAADYWDGGKDDALMVAAWKRLILRRRAEAARVEPAKPPVLSKVVEQCLALAK